LSNRNFFDGAATGRRQFLMNAATGLGALAVGAALPRAAYAAEAQTKGSRLVDVHLHYGGSQFDDAMKGADSFDAKNLKTVAQMCIDMMDKGGCEMGIFGIGSETPFKDLSKATANCRQMNENMAKAVSDNPKRFRFMASVPVWNMDDALKEVAYAMDTLKANGVHMFTSFEGKPMGDPMYAPLFDELNRRKIVIKTHPTVNPCCKGAGVPTGIIELGTDTMRAISTMLIGGNAHKYPDMKIIWSHEGGSLLALTQRLTGMMDEDKNGKLHAALPNGPDYELKRFYYDTAQAYHISTLAAAKAFYPLDHCLFGTDYPFRTVSETWAGITKTGIYNAAELKAIGGDNARKLLNLPA
jgi:predicted TIM-barrel fold metal-dependent hydrolase